MDWKRYVIQEYTQKLRSTSELGKELKKNPKIIRDVLIKAGVPLRNHSAAQKLVVKRDGPAIQRPRTVEEKKRISKGLRNFWEDLDPEAAEEIRAGLSDRAKEYWSGVTDKEKEAVLAKMKNAARSKAGQGSKAENKIADILKNNGVRIERRSKSYIHPYEVDIMAVDDRVAIEIDGPTHFKDIYGEDNLRKVQVRDATKNDYILALGISIIRCQDKTNSYSLASCERTAEQILEILKKRKTGKQKATLYFVDIR